MPKKRTLCLYGADRNGVPVCMFFAKKSHLKDFAKNVPGTYSVMKLQGIGYDDFDISGNRNF